MVPPTHLWTQVAEADATGVADEEIPSQVQLMGWRTTLLNCVLLPLLHLYILY